MEQNSAVGFFFTFILIPLIVGIISTLVYAIFSWWYKRPRLRFEVFGHAGEGQPTFYKIKVWNDGRETAMNCRLSLIYKDYKNEVLEPRIAFELENAKWDKNPNPIANGQPERSLLHLSGEVDIKAHTGEVFCILIRYDNEDNCYSFNADNYILGHEEGTELRVANRALDIGEYLVSAVIRGDNAEGVATFLIRNGATVQIEPKHGIY